MRSRMAPQETDAGSHDECYQKQACPGTENLESLITQMHAWAERES